MAREIGFRYPHIAVVKENTETNYKADTPVKLGRGIECKVSVKKDNAKQYSDNTIEKILYGTEDIEIDVTIDNLTPELMVQIFGGTYNKGLYSRPANAQPVEVAYLDEVLLDDNTYMKRVFYCGTFDVPSEDVKTLTDKPEGKGTQLKAHFYPRQKDIFSNARFYGGATGKDSAIEKAWFTNVTEPVASK